ncbi:MAG: asparagine synthase (glutamine-hydrolyzing) [Abitibacteriaceae bacterium]|nr:asparagine synthase (glutamine-hydrolyzing) [Abditibacteriaceae bacterium]
MCGIVGILQLNNEPVQREALQRMNDAIRHRGPDDEGLWLHGTVGLAMRRLAIIDLACGHQPLANEDETVWIVFNGEIYNFPELRQELESKGHQFRTHSDTEAIVHAYEEWGEDCPKHLRGMFAFAIYDLKTETLFLARDRVGKKPLLYTVVNNRLIFGSEFQALLTHTDVTRQPNLKALDTYLATFCIPAPMTGYEGIHKLPPAHSLTVRNGEIKLQRYWRLDFTPKIRISEADAVAELLHRLEEAVRIRLMSEVPLGAFLSGGIDSSAVVAVMSRLMDKPVKTFAIGFDESEYSEVHHARRLAERWGTDHTEIIIQPDALQVVPTLVRHYGEPYADSSAVPTYYVSQATRQSVTVALNGDGGDEVFAGYDRYYAMKLAETVPHALLSLGGKVAGSLPAHTHAKSRSARLKRLLQAAALPRAQRYLQWMSAFSVSQKQELYSPAFKEQVQFGHTLNPAEVWLERSQGLDTVDACLLTDTMTYLPDDLLVKVDITSMANSLEARSPLLDHQLMEWVAQLPPELKLHGKSSKYLLRKAMEGLVPEENMARRKMGFGVPVGHWFRGSMKGLLCDTVVSDRALARGYFEPDVVRRFVREHLESEANHDLRLWSLLMLELWHHEFID